MDNPGDLKKRERFKRFLKEKFFLRFHMSLILLGTALSGVLASWALLHLQVGSMLIRYPIAVVFSYIAFFGFIKLWLLYMASSAESRNPGKSSSIIENVDIGNIIPDGLPVSGPDISVSMPLSGGGGDFSGAGASGVFEQGSSTAESVGSSVADAAGDAVSGIFDDDGFVLLILGLILAVVCGAALYLVYAAPAILAEAAFDFVLASSLLKSAKRMDNPDWMGSVFGATVIPFVIVLVMAIAAAFVAHKAVPEAAKMSEVINVLLSR